MEAKKILIICSYPDSILSFRGPLISQFLKNNFEVHIACPNLTNNPISNELMNLNIHLHDLFLSRTSINLFKDIKTIFNLFIIIQSIKPDKVFMYTVKPVIYGLIISSLARVKSLFPMITGLGFAFQNQVGKKNFLQIFTSKLVKFLYFIALKNASKIFFQNYDDRTQFLTEGIINVNQKYFITNGSGVDTDFFQYSPINSQNVFLCISRLLVSKGIREYVFAAKEIKKINQNARFLLAGWIDDNPDSIDTQELHEWIENEDIEFLGKLNNQTEVKQAISQCAVYVLPSYREGTPRSVLEAMSMGRPILTTDVPGCRQTVETGFNGLLVSSMDESSLIQGMNFFLANQNKIEEMGNNSRKLALRRFDAKIVNNAIFHEITQ